MDYWLSTIDHRLLTIDYRLSTIERQSNLTSHFNLLQSNQFIHSLLSLYWLYCTFWNYSKSINNTIRRSECSQIKQHCLIIQNRSLFVVLKFTVYSLQFTASGTETQIQKIHSDYFQNITRVLLTTLVSFKFFNCNQSLKIIQISCLIHSLVYNDGASSSSIIRRCDIKIRKCIIL